MAVMTSMPTELALPAPAVPSYTALDLRLGWHVQRDLELSLTLRNLGDRRHAEWGAAPGRASRVSGTRPLTRPPR